MAVVSHESGWWYEHMLKVLRGPHDLSCGDSVGAGEGNRTLMTSLEDRGYGGSVSAGGLGCGYLAVTARE